MGQNGLVLKANEQFKIIPQLVILGLVGPIGPQH